MTLLLEVIAALATIGTAFISPVLADSGPINPDAGPTWTLAAACTFFLLALAYAIREAVALSKQAVATLYTEVVTPLARSQQSLLETMRTTRETDSKSLESIAEDVSTLRREIRCRHDEHDHGK